MPTLTPCLDFGSSSNLDVIGYAARDFRGVEALAAPPTDRRGFNEEAEWTGRAEVALTTEHTAAGVHSTLKIARAILVLQWDGTTGAGSYTARSSSYSLGTSGSAVATVVRDAVGEVTITLADAMPSTYMVPYSLTEEFLNPADFANRTRVRCYCKLITSTTVFTVWRWAGTLGALAKADGDMVLAIYAE